MEELFDILDANGEPTGETKLRAEVHKDGDWHRSFHLWIVRDDYVLFQRRAKTKDLEADKVDVTVGGHYRAGEGLAEVVREVEEEVGLFVRPEALHHLATQKAERHYETAIDREFQEVYVLKQEQPLEHYHLDCAEVSVLYELQLDKAIELYQNGGFAPVSGWDCQQRVNNALLLESDLIEQARAQTVEALRLVRGWLEAL